MCEVMVVDSSKMIRDYHGSIVTNASHELLEASSYDEALEKSKSANIGLFLLDVSMSGLGSYSLARELRKSKKYISTPIIITSLSSREKDAIRAYKAGANFYNAKPIKPEVLNSIMRLLCS